MRQRSIVADFLRRPQKPDNRLLEGMFVRAWQDLSRGEYPAAGSLLTWDNRILDLVEAWPKAPAR
jgi:hypothetical protein